MPKRTWEIVREIAAEHGMEGGLADELSRHRGTYEIRNGEATARFDRRGYGHTHVTLKGFAVPIGGVFGTLATLEEATKRVCEAIADPAALARATVDSEERKLRGMEAALERQTAMYESVLDALSTIAMGKKT